MICRAEGKRMAAVRAVRRRPEETLYHTWTAGAEDRVPVRMIPYFAWDNRGMGEMKIWFSTGI